MKTISLDLSTKNTGFAVFQEEKLIDYGCYSASSQDVIKRIYKIVDSLQELLDKHPDTNKIVIEEVRPENNQYGVGNLHTHKVLMWLQAKVIFMLHDLYPKVEIEYVYPSEWRKSCGIRTGKSIKREALKEADINFVYQQYGIKTNDDVADAIGIGHAFVNNLTNELNWA